MTKYFDRYFIAAYFSALAFFMGWVLDSVILQIFGGVCFVVFIILMVVGVIIECEKTPQNLKDGKKNG